jgi:hypothetical protein
MLHGVRASLKQLIWQKNHKCHTSFITGAIDFFPNLPRPLHSLHLPFLLIQLRGSLRWTAVASSPRSSWNRCACTWPPTLARSSPRRSASSTSSTLPPRSGLYPPVHLESTAKFSSFPCLDCTKSRPDEQTSWSRVVLRFRRSSASTRRSSWSTSRRARSPKVSPFTLVLC